MCVFLSYIYIYIYIHMRHFAWFIIWTMNLLNTAYEEKKDISPLYRHYASRTLL